MFIILTLHMINLVLESCGRESIFFVQISHIDRRHGHNKIGKWTGERAFVRTSELGRDGFGKYISLRLISI